MLATTLGDIRIDITSFIRATFVAKGVKTVHIHLHAVNVRV
jgi:hypothetical protein